MYDFLTVSEIVIKLCDSQQVKHFQNTSSQLLRSVSQQYPNREGEEREDLYKAKIETQTVKENGEGKAIPSKAIKTRAIAKEVGSGGSACRYA